MKNTSEVTEFAGLKVGDTVTIFEDPITKKQPEGDAVLTFFWGARSTKRGDPIESNWSVVFKDDPDRIQYMRTICHEEVNIP